MKLQKRWWLGFLGLIGFLKLPAFLEALHGEGPKWELLSVTWFIWLLYFVPEGEKKSATAPIPASHVPQEIPVTTDRQSLVDSLRGVALFGILIVNIGAFASPYYGLNITDPMATSVLSQLTLLLIALFFETKFYLLFSFLFGYSFTIQMQSADREGRSFTPKFVRRLLCLWAIGLFHAVFLYHGDILTTYAILGFILLAVRNQSDFRLGTLAFWLVVTTAVIWGLVSLLVKLDGTPVDNSDEVAQAAAALAAYRGTPARVVAQHLYELKQVWVVIGLMQAPTALAMFFAGLIAGRKKLLSQVGPHKRFFKHLVFLGVSIGLPGAVVYAYTSVKLSESGEILGMAIGLLTAPFLTAGYVGGLMLASTSLPGKLIAKALEPAGRMALTNYILQSLTCALIFYAYGLKLIGAVSPFAVLVLAIMMYATQVVFSHWWMQRFNYGPIEWVLRSVTNLRFSPFRLKK